MCAGWKRQFKVPRDTATRNAHAVQPFLFFVISKFVCFLFICVLFFFFDFIIENPKRNKNNGSSAPGVSVYVRREEEVSTLSGTRRTGCLFFRSWLLRSAESAGACARFLLKWLLWRRWRNNCNVNPTAWNGKKSQANNKKRGAAAAPIELEMIFVQLFQGISDDRHTDTNRRRRKQHKALRERKTAGPGVLLSSKKDAEYSCCCASATYTRAETAPPFVRQHRLERTSVCVNKMRISVYTKPRITEMTAHAEYLITAVCVCAWRQ